MHVSKKFIAFMLVVVGGSIAVAIVAVETLRETTDNLNEYAQQTHGLVVTRGASYSELRPLPWIIIFALASLVVCGWLIQQWRRSDQRPRRHNPAKSRKRV